MLKFIWPVLALVLMYSTAFAGGKVDEALKDITWIAHASFRITLEGKTIYIDPWNVKNAVPADYILITHDHYDHLSKKDIDKIKKADTVILCPKIVADKLPGYKTVVFRPGDKKQIGKLSFEAVAMYNLKKPFHPKEALYTGFIIEGNGLRIYNAGDTDLIPEMEKIRDITVAILPCGGTYTMDAKDCVRCAELIKPLIAIPAHYGTIVGDPKEVEATVAKSRVRFIIMKSENKRLE